MEESVAKALERIRKDRVQELIDSRPKGVFTRAEYQERFGLRRTAAKEQLQSLLAVGKIRRVRIWTRRNDYAYPDWGYQLVEE